MASTHTNLLLKSSLLNFPHSHLIAPGEGSTPMRGYLEHPPDAPAQRDTSSSTAPSSKTPNAQNLLLRQSLLPSSAPSCSTVNTLLRPRNTDYTRLDAHAAGSSVLHSKLLTMLTQDDASSSEEDDTQLPQYSLPSHVALVFQGIRVSLDTSLSDRMRLSSLVQAHGGTITYILTKQVRYLWRT